MECKYYVDGKCTDPNNWVNENMPEKNETKPLKQPAIVGNAYLVLMRWDYAPYRIVVFAKTEREALGKAKRKFTDYEILSAEHVRHCL